MQLIHMCVFSIVGLTTDRNFLLQVLQHGLAAVPAFQEQLDRGHLLSGSTLKGHVVSHMVMAKASASLASQKPRASLNGAMARLVGHSKNIHTLQHMHDVHTLLEQRRHFEREAAVLRIAASEAQVNQRGHNTIEKLNAFEQDLIRDMRGRQDQARELANTGGSYRRQIPLARLTAAQEGSGSQSCKHDRVPVKERKGASSTLPAFQLASGLKEPVDLRASAMLAHLKVLRDQSAVYATPDSCSRNLVVHC
jgi:hypothetical protein